MSVHAMMSSATRSPACPARMCSRPGSSDALAAGGGQFGEQRRVGRPAPAGSRPPESSSAGARSAAPPPRRQPSGPPGRSGRRCGYGGSAAGRRTSAPGAGLRWAGSRGALLAKPSMAQADHPSSMPLGETSRGWRGRPRRGRAGPCHPPAAAGRRRGDQSTARPCLAHHHLRDPGWRAGDAGGVPGIGGMGSGRPRLPRRAGRAEPAGHSVAGDAAGGEPGGGILREGAACSFMPCRR